MPWPGERDNELFELIDRERDRQNSTLQLIASENFTSPAVLEATGSVLTNKYSEGYPGKRYYGGNVFVDEVEDLARERAKELFGADHANVQPHSGANANMAVYLAVLEPGDKVMGMSLDHGGHLTHGSPVNASGRLYDFVAYGVTPSDERLDYDQIRDRARAERPKLIIAGATAYPRVIEPAPLREIADEVGALLMFDAAHIAGLDRRWRASEPGALMPTSSPSRPTRRCVVLAGAACCAGATWPRPSTRRCSPDCRVARSNTSSRPRPWRFARRWTRRSRRTRSRSSSNAQSLAGALAAEGFRLVSGGTDNHLMLVDLRQFDADLTGKEAQTVLDRAGITLNKNTIPDDPRSPFVTSGVRIGTPSVTTQGMTEAQMTQIAGLIARALRVREDDAELAVGSQRSQRAVRRLHPVRGLSNSRP